MGNAIVVGVSVLLFLWTGNDVWSLLIGFCLGVLSGAVKELFDRYTGLGTYDVLDFYSTAWGSVIGLVMSVVIIDLIK